MQLLLPLSLSIVILGFLFSAAEASRQSVRKRLNNKGQNAIDGRYLDLTSEVDQDVLKRLNYYRKLDEPEEASSEPNMSMSMSMPMSMSMSMSMPMSMSMSMPMAMPMPISMSMSMSMPTSIITLNPAASLEPTAVPISPPEEPAMPLVPAAMSSDAPTPASTDAPTPTSTKATTTPPVTNTDFNKQIDDPASAAPKYQFNFSMLAFVCGLVQLWF